MNRQIPDHDALRQAWTRARPVSAPRSFLELGDTNSSVQAVAAVASQAGGPITQAIAAVFSLLGAGGAFNDTKKLYHELDPIAIQTVQTYGPDIGRGSAALGLNVNAVAQAVSDYLSYDGIHLTPQQIMANSNAGSVSSVLGGNLAPYILGGGALIAVLIMVKGHR